MNTFIYNPRLLRHIDFFDQSFQDWFHFEDVNKSLSRQVKTTDDSISISVDVPGYSKDDIQVNYEDEYVTVLAKNDELNRPSIKKQFFVGPIEVESSISTLENGVLNVQLEKSVSAKRQIISIR